MKTRELYLQLLHNVWTWRERRLEKTEERDRNQSNHSQLNIISENKDDKNTETAAMMVAVRGGQDGEPLLKQKDLRTEEYRRRPMKIEHLLQPEHYARARSKPKRAIKKKEITSQKIP